MNLKNASGAAAGAVRALHALSLPNDGESNAIDSSDATEWRPVRARSAVGVQSAQYGQQCSHHPHAAL